MNKRLLSLLLVLCMVLVSVPVLALPMSAAGNETAIYKYTSSYTDNLVTASGAAPVFHGNWSVVAYTPGDYTNPAAATAVSWVGASGNYNGLATTGGNGFLSISATNQNYQGIGTVGSNTSQSMAVRYTAEKTGTADILFDKLGQIGSGAIGTYTYYVYVNGVKVWPTGSQNNQVTGPNAVGQEKTALIYDETTVAVKGVSLKAGDTVDFICEGNQASNLWGNGGNAMFGTIAYTSVAATHTTYFTGNMPTMNGSAPAFHGNWSFVGYVPGAYSDYKNVYTTSGWAGGLHGFNDLATTTNGNGTVGGWYNMTNTHGNWHGIPGTVGASTAESMAIRYTAEYTGTANIAFEKLGNVANSAAGQFTYFIYKNGVKIWPLNGENNTVTGKNMIYTTKTEVVANLSLNAGDIIDFICEGASARNAWGNGGNAMFGIVEYTAMAAPAVYSSSFNSTTNLPTLNADGTITFNGNWSAHVYRRMDAENNGAVDYDFTSWKFPAMNGATSTPTAGHIGWTAIGDAWGANMNLTGTHVNHTANGTPGVLGASSAASAVLVYEAEKTGTIDIILNKVGNISPNADFDVSKFRYGVFVGNDMVWPANDGTLLYNTPALDVNGATGANQYLTDVQAASDIKVNAGDKIYFVVEGNAKNINLGWGGCANAMFATVKYTDVMPTATASATVSVGATVNATAKVTMPAEVYFPAEVGMYIDGVKTANTTAAILANVAIKDIETTSVKVQPYYTTTQGAEILGAEYTVTIADLLKKISATDAKAAAVLNYAAAAQKYFNIEGTLQYTAPTLTGTYTDNLAIVGEKLADARVIPTEVALLLKDTVSFKFTLDGAEDGDVLRMTSGADSATFAIENGVVEVTGIGIDKWDTTFTFVVEDENGVAVSSTFTYSVSTYYARMNGKDANLTDLVTAMMALYETL